MRVLSWMVLAALAMAGVVLGLPFESVGSVLLRLALKLAACAVLYPLVLTLLWLACGCPKSVEATLVGVVRSALARRRAA